MRTYPEYSVVFPAYNEEDRLEPTIRETVAYFRTKQAPAEIIVVDDGSRDATSALVQRLSAEFEEIRLIRLARNRGKGHAVRSGVVNAEGRYVLFADADGSTPIAEIERLESALHGGAAIAIGSREIGGDGTRVRTRWYRRVIGRAFHALVTTLTVRGILDTQCGFKLLRSDVAQELFSRMRMEGFSFDVELLMMAQRRGHPIAEVPVNWTHRPGSRVSLVADSARMARDLFVIRAHALRGHYDAPHLAPLAPLARPPVSARSVADEAVHASVLS
ncbi:MAG TPA: dolichyl-phosphate beta-glucosyltransferase [Gemmatimonadaceae bacterium]|jgi:dolichyl-phosphate beta-glucosyltransferase|nr:dolichyl-phosphate beta-glucosyltransferase [Gemmatimonadaceae bacterium]